LMFLPEPLRGIGREAQTKMCFTGLKWPRTSQISVLMQKGLQAKLF
jgi:hypothetical protein